MSLRHAALALAGFLALSTTAFADTASAQLTIQNRAFTTSELQVPADTKIKLVVENQDSIPAEFESYDLSREVVVPGHSSIVVYIGPLSPGKYNFFNDFNHAAQGWVIAGPPEAAKPGNQR